MLEVRSEQMERVRSLLGSLPGNKTKAALSNASYRAMQTARARVWDSVKDVYAVKRSAFTRETKIRLYRANSSAVGAGLEFKGHLIPLIDYNVRSYRSHESRSQRLLKVEVFRGAEEMLRHAYIANLGMYGEGIFERLGTRRDLSQRLYGPSAAHMADNAAVMDDISKAAQQTFDDRLEHEIDRILRGYGL